MAVEDLRDHPDGSVLTADVCIVGSGPAGMTVALRLAAAGVSVCLVESGGDSPDPEVEHLNEIDNVGMRRAPQDSVRARGLGGTSSLWSGRCGVLDAVDYAARPWVPHSGWPVDHDDIAPHLPAAGELLGLGPSRYGGAAVDRVDLPDGEPWDPRLLQPLVFQASAADPDDAEAVRSVVDDGVDGAEHIGVLQHAGTPRPVDFAQRHLPGLVARPNVRVLRRATAVEVQTEDDGRSVTGVVVAGTDGRRARVASRRVVLACGGIENARLLLASPGGGGRGLGNERDVVGRYLMDHPFAPVAEFGRGGSRRLRRRFGQRWVDVDGARHVYSIGVRLSPEAQRAEGLLNAQIHTVDQGDLRSSLRRVHEAVQAVRAEGVSRDRVAELASAARRPDQLAWMAYERQVLRRPSLVDADRVVFGCVVEQVPDPSSRVTLSDRVDDLGMPRARVDWRAADAEIETLQRMVEIFVAEVRRLGEEPPELAPWLADGAAGWRATVHDMAHPLGTTRMAEDPRAGVVDRDCAVHGVDGLFVAGSSVFATSGYVNPTLTIVALALRLAEHLGAELAGRQVARPLVRPPLPDEAPLRVGFVGLGRRAAAAHLPIMRALPERFEPVGFSSRTPARLGQVAGETGLDGFGSPAELVERASPDLLLVAVEPHVVDEALPPLVELGVPLLVETPVAWQLAAGRALVKRIDELGLVVGVAEQTPFLPVEQLKQRLVALGVLGHVVLAENDFAAFDYHAVAALRRAMGSARVPATVQATTVPLGGSEARVGLVTMRDGGVLHHRFVLGGETAGTAARWPGRLGLLGSAGTFVGDELRASGPDGQILTATVERHVQGGTLQALSVEGPDGEVRWRNPFADLPFTDEDIAVATVLTTMVDAVRSSEDPPYLPSESLADMEIIAAMRYSAAGQGRPITLPVDLLDQVRYRVGR